MTMSSRPSVVSPTTSILPRPGLNSCAGTGFAGIGSYALASRVFISHGKISRRHYSGGLDPTGGYVMNAYWILLGLNAIPFGLFLYAQYTNNRKLEIALLQNTLTSVSNVESGRWWTVLTSAFSHQSLSHFAFNMFTMNAMCSVLTRVPGIHGGHIIGVALGAAIAGSGSFLLQQRALMSASNSISDRARAYNSSAIGASGAVMGLSALATCFVPTTPMNLMFIPIPIPLWVITAAYFAVDAYQLDSKNSRVAHAGHLGGAAFGLASYFLLLKGLAPFGVWYKIAKFLGRR